MRVVPPEVATALSQCFDDVERQMRRLSCADVARDEDLGWTFDEVLEDWSVSVVLDGAVERRDNRLLVPMVAQARRGLGLRGHRGDTMRRTVVLDCEE